MFLDAMEFWNEQAGIVIGDPIDGHFSLRELLTVDRLGATYSDKRPAARLR